MSEFKVLYLFLDGTVRSQYVNAVSKDAARDFVYGHAFGCVMTLSAEYTS